MHLTRYEQLTTELHEVLEASASFVPAAFHVHSPESHDWGNRTNADADLNSRGQYLSSGGEKHFLDLLAKSLRIACITDHMKCDYACRLARAARKGRGVVVFPGMEISCEIPPNTTSRIHILAIFPSSKNQEKINSIFHGIEVPAEEDRTGTEVARFDSLLDLVDRIRSEGGIAIPAHIDGAAGHRRHFRMTQHQTLEMFDLGEEAKRGAAKAISEEYKSHIAGSGVAAIEIAKRDERGHYIGFETSEGRKRVPCVMRSDMHCVEDFRDRERYTWVKLSTVDFDCLKRALEFFETRIKFADDLEKVVPPYIKGLKLSSPDGEGLFTEAALGFSRNLNCIIGPRGSGKTTLVEAIRYVLCQNENLADSEGYPEQSGDSFKSVALSIQKANLRGTKIELMYESDSGPHVLVAPYDPTNPRTTDGFDLEDDRTLTNGEGLLQRFPARIYSWSELENLGRSSDRQRELLDRFIDKLPEYREKREDCYRRLADNHNILKTLCDRMTGVLEQDKGLLREYVERKKAFERVNTEEVALLFEDLDFSRGKVAAIKDMKVRLSKRKEEIEQSLQFNISKVSTYLRSKFSPQVAEWWRDRVEPVLRLVDVDAKLSEYKAHASTLLDAAISHLSTMLETERKLKLESESKLRQQTQASVSEDLRNYERERLKARYEEAKKRRQEYKEIQSQFEKAMEARNVILKDLEAQSHAISGVRNSLNEVLEKRLEHCKSGGIDIEIQRRPGRDRREAIEYMREGDFLVGAVFGKYKYTRIAERCCSMALPITIARAILQGDPMVLEEDGASLDTPDSLTTEEAKKLVGAFHPYAHDEGADVDTVDFANLGRILNLQEQRWDDEIQILLNGTPIDKHSPGSRCSAILPLVALAESVPLIIDQPEDNLDNRIIGTTLTRVLAELKEARQMILTTHNPNIVVGGDAEQVVVLDTRSERNAEVGSFGCIDSPEIVHHVLDLMEGGREAFEVRKRRYESS